MPELTHLSRLLYVKHHLHIKGFIIWWGDLLTSVVTMTKIMEFILGKVTIDRQFPIIGFSCFNPSQLMYSDSFNLRAALFGALLELWNLLGFAKFVFVHHDAVGEPLKAPYDGPFWVICSGKWEFIPYDKWQEQLDFKDRLETATILLFDTQNNEWYKRRHSFARERFEISTTGSRLFNLITCQRHPAIPSTVGGFGLCWIC